MFVSFLNLLIVLVVYYWINTKTDLMKKVITFLFLVGFSGIFATTSAQHLDIRAYGGLNVVQLSNDGGTTLIDGALHQKQFAGRAGYQFGAMVTFGDRFFVQPGLQYTSVLTELRHTTDSTKFTDETSVNMFSVPLRVGFRLLPHEAGKILNVRIFGGFEGHHVTSVSHDKKSGKVSDIEKDDFTNLIVNADFGMGVDIAFLFVDAGYQLGLNSITSGSNTKANAFYANVGLKLGL